MNNSKCGSKTVFLVHHEDCVREYLYNEIQKRGFRCVAFDSPDKCIQRLSDFEPPVLVAPLKIPNSDGLHLLEQIKQHSPCVNLIFFTRYATIARAVKAVRQGAFSLVDHNCHHSRLFEEIEMAIEHGDRINMNLGLTPAETKIFELILEGYSNKEIAKMLHRSVRTIEDHRARIMKKAGAENVVELVKKAFSLGLISNSAGHYEVSAECG
ncbi:Transcriptional regulatory protein FixJ [Anaerohalosphaera lusitana]|uniref:Transcriptional regulatory protein FixJ n=2 Tax=Anaerohalosphaera lusitana TaxID=1936003 RepID=A0A1U9NKQ4_9BACT|nr:Transcriptional regulatory protein FixJ [Anaerohalosphaera lusitana]